MTRVLGGFSINVKGNSRNVLEQNLANDLEIIPGDVLDVSVTVAFDDEIRSVHRSGQTVGSIKGLDEGVGGGNAGAQTQPVVGRIKVKLGRSLCQAAIAGAVG